MDPILDYYSKKSEAVGSFKVPDNGDVFEPTTTYNNDDKGEQNVIFCLFLPFSFFFFPSQLIKI